LLAPLHQGILAAQVGRGIPKIAGSLLIQSAYWPSTPCRSFWPRILASSAMRRQGLLALLFARFGVHWFCPPRRSPWSGPPWHDAVYYFLRESIAEKQRLVRHHVSRCSARCRVITPPLRATSLAEHVEPWQSQPVSSATTALSRRWRAARSSAAPRVGPPGSARESLSLAPRLILCAASLASPIRAGDPTDAVPRAQQPGMLVIWHSRSRLHALDDFAKSGQLLWHNFL